MHKRLEIRNTGVLVTDVLSQIASGAGYSQILRRFPKITRSDIARAASIALDIILKRTHWPGTRSWNSDDDRELIRLRSNGAGITRLARIFVTSESEITNRLNRIGFKP